MSNNKNATTVGETVILEIARRISSTVPLEEACIEYGISAADFLDRCRAIPDVRPVANVGTRFGFLAAVQDEWPEVLKALRDYVYPSFQDRITPPPDVSGWCRSLFLTKGNNDRLTAEDQNLTVLLRNWADSFSLNLTEEVAGRDPWIMDAALQTLHAWKLLESAGDKPDPLRWHYLAAGLAQGFQAPQFGAWLPRFTSWRAFKRTTDQIYNRQLSQYRENVAKLWSNGKPKMAEHARWLVLWQKGKSPEFIRRVAKCPSNGRRSTASNIQQRVHELANQIDLQLRAPKAGRRARRK